MVCDEGGPDGAPFHLASMNGGLESDGSCYGVLVDAEGVEVVVVDDLSGLLAGVIEDF